MAFQQFFVQGGTGNDKNSGASSSNTIAYSSTSGNWDGTSVFTPTDGSTPSSTVTVGDWVSVCTNASTATSYVAQVTAVGAGVNGTITVSTTAKYGTVLASQTGTATLIDGGSWNSIQPIVNFSTATVPGSTQFCIKAATYTLSGTLTLALTGLTTGPVWFRGYNTTVGDLDNGSTSLSYPTVSGAFGSALKCAYALYSGLSFTSSLAGNAVAITTAGPQEFRHCRFVTTSVSASAVPISLQNFPSIFIDCYLSGTSGNNALISIFSIQGTFLGCYFNGAASGSTQAGIASGSAIIAIGCTFNKLGSHGISCGSGEILQISGCTFNACGGDGIHIASAVVVITTSRAFIANNVFANSGGYDINNASGANTCNYVIANNDSYLPTSGHLNGFGDYPELNPLVEGSSPFTSSTNLALLSTAVGAGAGLPGQWENVTAGLGGFPDVGAWQQVVSSGGVPFPIVRQMMSELV